MNNTFDYDVFVSHSSQDKRVVHALAERLKQEGLRVWLDAWAIQPGDPISLAIQHGLEQSRTLLMCMSQAYFDSEWATLEHHTLLFRDPTNEKRRFIPLLIEDCTMPTSSPSSRTSTGGRGLMRIMTSFWHRVGGRGQRRWNRGHGRSRWFGRLGC